MYRELVLVLCFTMYCIQYYFTVMYYYNLRPSLLFFLFILISQIFCSLIHFQPRTTLISFRLSIKNIFMLLLIQHAIQLKTMSSSTLTILSLYWLLIMCNQNFLKILYILFLTRTSNWVFKKFCINLNKLKINNTLLMLNPYILKIN